MRPDQAPHLFSGSWRHYPESRHSARSTLSSRQYVGAVLRSAIHRSSQIRCAPCFSSCNPCSHEILIARLPIFASSNSTYMVPPTPDFCSPRFLLPPARVNTSTYISLPLLSLRIHGNEDQHLRFWSRLLRYSEAIPGTVTRGSDFPFIVILSLSSELLLFAFRAPTCILHL